MCYKKHLYEYSDFLGCDDSSIVVVIGILKENVASTLLEIQ